MANKGKKSAEESAAQRAAEQQAPNNNSAKTEKEEAQAILGVMKTMKSNSLSQDGKAITANLIQKRWVEGENVPASIRDGGNILVDALLGDIVVTGIAEGNNAFAFLIAKDEAKYLSIKAAMAEMGVALPEFKALPAPTEEQLKGLGVKLLPSQAAVVTVSPEDVNKGAIAKKKKEMEAVAKAVSNPAEIKTEEQLRESLTAMLVKSITDGVDRPDARVQRTIKFYRGYLTIQANAAEDKEAALKEVKEKSMSKMLDEISEIVGPCPFALSGTAYFLRKRAAETGLPISSFCLYRRSAIPSSDGTIDDQYMADITRILLMWSCKSRIAECEASLKAQAKIVKNESGAAKTATETAMRFNEKTIEELNKIISETNSPSHDVIDKLIENYNLEDTKSEEYKLAHRIVDDIMKTYYPEYVGKKYDTDAMLKNVQQRAGIIINMFRDSLSQSISYAESNLVEIAIEEEGAGEEDGKN